MMQPVLTRSRKLIALFSLLLFFLQGADKLFAQSGDLNVEATYRAMVSGSELPFFFYANRWGLVHPDALYQNLGEFSADKTVLSTPGGFTLNAGSTLAMRQGDTGNTAHFQQLYLSAEYLGFRLSTGRFYDVRGITMEPLSMGSMTQSRNATPVPKIKFETTDFTNVPFTNGFLQFHFQYSDGILEENRVIQSPFLHQKSLHLKFHLGKLELIAGIDHNVVWAGNQPEIGKRPQGLSDYFRVVFSRSASPGSGASESETINRLGNTVGGYDIGINYPMGGGMFRAYRTLFIEDRPAWQFRSPWDGLWGFGYQRNEPGHVIDAVLYEHMNTIRQDAIRHIPKGRARYYMHGQYQNGWAYNGHVLGNPLITYDREIRRVTNNMILAHHVALTGNPSPRFGYTLFVNYSRNYGLCSDRVLRGTCAVHLYEPPPEDNLVSPRRHFRQDRLSLYYSMNLLLSRSNHLSLLLAFGADAGQFSGERMGAMAGVKWEL